MAYLTESNSTTTYCKGFSVTHNLLFVRANKISGHKSDKRSAHCTVCSKKIEFNRAALNRDLLSTLSKVKNFDSNLLHIYPFCCINTLWMTLVKKKDSKIHHKELASSPRSEESKGFIISVWENTITVLTHFQVSLRITTWQKHRVFQHTMFPWPSHFVANLTKPWFISATVICNDFE